MLEKASNAKKILMLFMSENAKNYAGLFYRWLPMTVHQFMNHVQVYESCRYLMYNGMYSVCTVYVQCMYSVCTVYVQCMYSVCK